MIALAVAVAVLFGLSTQPQETSATDVTKWPPLSETCHDVSGDGTVDLFNDILGVVARHGTEFGGPPNEAGFTYALLYDVDGGGRVDLFGDILSTVAAFGQTCSLIDQQVVQATVATMKYQDPAVAIADGYEQYSADVPGMGIHMFNRGFQTLYPHFAGQMTHPVGLVYTDADPTAANDVPDELVGVWYIIPTPDVCAHFGIPGPCYPDQPEGFDGPEDLSSDTNDGHWHKHTNSCVGRTGTHQAWWITDLSSYTEDDCNAGETYGCGAEPCEWIAADYGWMMHMYNFVPNPHGRFFLWNSNVPYTDTDFVDIFPPLFPEAAE